eukprot:4207107-Ditylum_brightwellii.AAC.1
MHAEFVRILNDAKSINFVNTRHPQDVNEIPILFTRGKHSICSNVPHPKIKIVDGHSYVPVSSIADYILATGLPLSYGSSDTSKNDDYIWNTKEGEKNCEQ